MTDPAAAPPSPSAGTPAAACHALVPCAGIGARSGAAGPKQYVPLAGKPMVAHTLDALLQVTRLASVLVVLAPDDETYVAVMPPSTPSTPGSTPGSKPRLVIEKCGGNTRADTVANGLQALRDHGASDDDWVLVHDAARCLLRPEWVDALIDACLDDDVGGLLALPVADTLKDEQGGRVRATVTRARKWQAQTPQMFRLGLLARALDEGRADPARAAAITDEASAIEALGLAPRLVPGSNENFKLTWPADFDLAERLLSTR